MFFSVNVYSYLLPNGEELLSQADELFKKLLDDFHRCIAVNEIRPGLIRCDRQLRDYIAEFNFRFTKGRGSKSTAAKRSDIFIIFKIFFVKILSKKRRTAQKML
jgi:hypothetical protein